MDSKAFGGFHVPFVEPSIVSVETQAEKLTATYEQKDRKYRYSVEATDFKLAQVSLMKWQYGNARYETIIPTLFK